MHLIRGLYNWPDAAETALTIGNFDGVHLGHQAMFDALTTVADERGLVSTVISFEPLPQEFFMPRAAPARLQGLRDRYLSLQQTGIERFLVLRFNKDLAAQTGEAFIDKVLIDTLNVRHMIIGDDFRFGHRRDGSFELLQAAADRHGFSLHRAQTSLCGDERVSSTRVRRHLHDGELDAAAALLGRPYRISGRVIHGEKLGRQLGFPTANVALGNQRPALRGVFAARVHDQTSGQSYPAVANLGERPTVGGRRLLLEVHLLDTDTHVYGHHLAVDFLAGIRHEQRFASLEELRRQITRDAATARDLLSRR